MSVDFFKARAARTQQSQRTLQGQTEAAIVSSRAARLEQITQILAPQEEARAAEEAKLVSQDDEEIQELNAAERNSDGSRQALDEFASRRREIEHRRARHLTAAEHHAAAARALWQEALRLNEHEQRAQRVVECDGHVAKAEVSQRKVYDCCVEMVLAMLAYERSYNAAFYNFADVGGQDALGPLHRRRDELRIAAIAKAKAGGAEGRNDLLSLFPRI